MKLLTRALALGVGPMIAVTVFSLVGGRTLTPAELGIQVPKTADMCSQPPVFKPGYQLGENYVVKQGEGFKFGGESWVEANLCSAGVLNIMADGELGGDEEPQLTVILDSEIIATESFSQRRNIVVKIPRPGLVYLGFFNDYYLADVRIAFLSNVRLEAPNCEGFKSVIIKSESAGSWAPETRNATLVYDPPMKLSPCAAGRLKMEVQGREGKGSFPTLEFKQDGETLRTLKTNSNNQTVDLHVSAEPLTIAVSNPYGESLEDRNLNVRRVEFIPREP